MRDVCQAILMKPRGQDQIGFWKLSIYKMNGDLMFRKDLATHQPKNLNSDGMISGGQSFSLCVDLDKNASRCKS